MRELFLFSSLNKNRIWEGPCLSCTWKRATEAHFWSCNICWEFLDCWPCIGAKTWWEELSTSLESHYTMMQLLSKSFRIFRLLIRVSGSCLRGLLKVFHFIEPIKTNYERSCSKWARRSFIKLDNILSIKSMCPGICYPSGDDLGFLQDSITSLHLYLIFRDDAKNEVPSCLLLGKAYCQKIWQACPSKGIVILLLWVLWWLVFFSS